MIKESGREQYKFLIDLINLNQELMIAFRGLSESSAAALMS